MSYPYSLVKTANSGDTIFASDRNAEHTNHITNNIPGSIQSYSTSLSVMQTQTDPYPASVESRPSTLAGEIERLRYILSLITGKTYWYTHPDTDLATLSATQTDVNNLKSALSDGATPASTASSVKVRGDQIVSQLKLITGGANWYTAPATTLSSLNSSNTTNTNSISYLQQNQRNILINGGMEIWQRNTSFAGVADSTWTADRWMFKKSGGTPPTVTVSRDSSNQDSGTYSLNLNITATGSTSPRAYIQQPIENYQEFKSKTVYVSCRVKTSNAGIKIQLDDGVSTSASSATAGSGNYVTLSVSQAISASATKLNINIGFIDTNIPATGNNYIDSVMLIVGSDVPTFVPEDPAIALARCQRWYETGGNATNFMQVIGQGGSDGINYYLGVPIRFAVEKQATPTITATLVKVTEDGSSVDAKASYTNSPALVDTFGFTYRAFKGIAGSRPNVVNFYWVAEV